jgi:hypothetical protein
MAGGVKVWTTAKLSDFPNFPDHRSELANSLGFSNG